MYLVIMRTKLTNLAATALCLHRRQAELRFCSGNVITCMSPLTECTKRFGNRRSYFVQSDCVTSTIAALLRKLQNICSKFEWLPTLAVFFLR